jgi:hypothetical protein
MPIIQEFIYAQVLVVKGSEPKVHYLLYPDEQPKSLGRF